MTKREKLLILSLVFEEKYKYNEHLKWLKNEGIKENELPIKSTEKYINELTEIIIKLSKEIK